MASYRFEWKRSAEKDVRKLDSSRIPAIIQTVERLADKPCPLGCRKLHGTDRQYRIRIGDYRVLYEVDKAIFSHVEVFFHLTRPLMGDPINKIRSRMETS